MPRWPEDMEFSLRHGGEMGTVERMPLGTEAQTPGIL